MNRKFTEQELLEARQRNNKSIKYKNDTVWESNNYGSFSIIGRFDSKHLYIKFVDTGAIYVRQISAICSGAVKDVYAKNIYNKGFIGEGKYSGVSHKTLYSRWKGMLNRVYSGNCPTYKDCSIDEQWLNFQNFAKDIEELMREKGIDNLEGYEIDKDIKSNGAKVYSKKTVSIITHLENIKEMHSRVYDTVYVAKNIITEEEIEFTNQAQFAKEHGLDNSHISKVLNGKGNRVGCWTFYIKGEKAPDICVYLAENIKTGEIIEFTNQSQFAREHNLNQSKISEVLNGKRKTTGGWKFYKKEK